MIQTQAADAATPHGPGAIPLDALDLTIAAALMLVAGVISVALRLRLERQLAIASIRTVVQLLLIGFVLRWVFQIESVLAILALTVLMIFAATWAAVSRPDRSFRGVGWRAFGALVLSSWITTLAVTQLIIGVEPWYRPQYLIPLLGMVLGNSLTGISLALDQLLETLSRRRDEVEMELAHGATSWEAAREPLAGAVRRGMIPVVNSMMVVGLVALPGMMTGQILAGADPLEAVKYQIVVMFMIATATALGCILAVLLAFQRLFTKQHQLDAAAIVRRA